MGVGGDRQDEEIFGAQGSGTTETFTVVEAEEGVHCLSKEVEEQDVKRQAAMVVQMVSWEAKEVEAHSREEQHEHVLWSLFAESLVEEVAEELHLWQVSAE